MLQNNRMGLVGEVFEVQTSYTEPILYPEPIGSIQIFVPRHLLAID